MNNVYEWGLLHLGVTRAASLLNTVWWLTNADSGVAGQAVLMRYLPAGTGTLTLGFVTKPDPTAPFPYGLTVSPP